MADGTMVEFEPIVVNHNTEVKVPVESRTQSFTDKINVNIMTETGTLEDQSDSDNENDNQYLIEYNRLSSLYRQLPTDIFVQSVLRDYTSDEEKLDSVRHLFFSALRENADFPYGVQAELKRRVFTRKGEPVCVKLATDIHTLLAVLKGEDYSCLRGMISATRSRVSSQANVPTAKASSAIHSANSPANSSNDIALLKDNVASLQTDILMLKQRLSTNEQIEKEKLSTVWRTVETIKADVSACSESVHVYVSSLINKIDGIDPLVQTIGARLLAVEQKINDIDRFLCTPGTVVVTKCDIFETHNNVANAVPNVNCLTNVPSVVEASINGESTIADIPSIGNKNIENRCSNEVNNYTELFIDINHDDVESEVESPLTFGNMEIPKRLHAKVIVATESEISYFCSGQGSVNCHSFLSNSDKSQKCRECPTHTNSHFNNAIRDVPIKSNTKHASLRQTDAVKEVRSTIKPIPVRMVPRLSQEHAEGYASGRRRTKRFFVGWFSNRISIDKLSTFVTNRGPKVTMMRKFISRRNPNKSGIRLYVESNDYADLVLEDGFWPKDIVCRPWLSRGSLRNRYNGDRQLRDVSSDKGHQAKPYAGVIHTNRFATLCTDVD